MTDSESELNQTPASASGQSQNVIDRLVFAGLKEQIRARRWRVFYMLFFIGLSTDKIN